MEVVVDYVFLGFVGTVVVTSFFLGGLLIGLAIHGRRHPVGASASEAPLSS